MAIYDDEGNKSAEDIGKKADSSYSGEDLQNMEEEAPLYSGSSAAGKEGSDESKSLSRSGLYRPDNDGEPNGKIESSNTRKKVAIGGGIITLLFGGGIGLFGLLAGPLQLLQMSSMLSSFHFSDGEDLSDSRMVKASRYIKYGGDERTRLSVLGNKYANRIETKLNKSGLKSTYEGKLSSFNGYDIDLETARERGTFGNLSGKTPEEASKIISERYGIDSTKVRVQDGNIRIDADGLGTLKSKQLLTASLQDAGYSKVGAAIRARIMGRRAGVTWSPIKKLDTKIKASTKARITEYFEARKTRIESGVEAPVKSVSEEPKDADGDNNPDADPDSKAAADSANAAAGDTPENIKKKLSTKDIAGGAAAIVGILCIADALADQYDSIKHANVVLPLMRLGVEGMAVGNQMITGQNLDPAHIDAMTKLMYDKETQTSWRTAKSVQYEAGETPNGTDILDEARVSSESNIFKKVLDNIPLLGPTCNVINSTIGSWTLNLLGGGPISIIADFVTETFIAGPLLSGFINWIAGNPIDVNVAGANYGNYINYGARLAANDSMISSGGRKLSGAEVAELKQEQKIESEYEFSQKSLFAKIFDAKDYRTPAGKFIAEQAPDPAQNIARVATVIPKNFATIFNPLSALFKNKVFAEDSNEYDYGFDKYGFSSSEINSAVVENPFENDKIVADMLDSNAAYWSDITKKCFGISITKINQSGKNVWAPVSENSVPEYGNINSAGECSDSSEDFLRIRMWVHDSQLMAATACFEDGKDGVCDDFGFQAAGTSAASSVQQLNCDGYYQLTKIPAVIINGIPEDKKLVNYSPSERSTCEALKLQCSAGVSGSTKAICGALELDNVYYGSTSLQDSASKYYGFRVETNALYDVVGWFEKRELGLNPKNVLECSALTTAAVYRAFGEVVGWCSGNWNSASHPNLLKSVTATEVQPGDFLTTTKGCNQGERAVSGSHIVVAASSPDSSGRFVIYESSGHGKTTHFSDANVNDFSGGYITRWIGPGL